jgi:hypothetical protein
MPPKPASISGAGAVAKSPSHNDNVRGRDDHQRLNDRDETERVNARPEDRQHQSGGGKDDQETGEQATTQLLSELGLNMMSGGAFDLDFVAEKLESMSAEDGIFEVLLPDNETLGVVVQHNKNGIHLILSTKN